MTETILSVSGPVVDGADEILSADALTFVASLCTRFTPEITHLMSARVDRQQAISRGNLPDFLAETADVRAGDWKVTSVPHDLQDRRVEITAPTDRKMIINALNSGADVFMADFEDSNSPTWYNNIEGQVNLCDAVGRTIELVDPKGKTYRLNPKIATLVVRPRGWHLTEKHLVIDRDPISAALFDFGFKITPSDHDPRPGLVFPVAVEQRHT